MTIDFHVEALAGQAARSTLSFEPGHSISLGSEGDCVVTGEGVLSLHGCLAFFDGELWALSASVSEPIYVGKLPAVMWTVVPEGSVLSIGSARLRVTAGEKVDEESAIDVDLSELKKPSLRLRIPRYDVWQSAPY